MQAFKQIEPRALGQKAHIFSEGGEDAPGEKLGDFLWLVFQFGVARENGKLSRNFTRDARSLSRGIEGVGIEPDGAQAVANLRLCNLFNTDAKGSRVRKGQVGFSSQRKVGVDLYGMADIDDDEKRRPALRCRERLGITLGLSSRRKHGCIPPARSTHCGAAFHFSFGIDGGRLKECFLNGIAALLGFEDKAVAGRDR